MRRSRPGGIRLLIARPKLYMRKYGDVSGLGDRSGQENIFPSIRAAVDAIAPQDTPEGSDTDPDGSADQSYRSYFERQQKKTRIGPDPTGPTVRSRKKPRHK